MRKTHYVERTDGYHMLAAAIIESAAREYIHAIRKHDYMTMNENEAFFESDWFDVLAYDLHVDGLEFEKKLQKVALNPPKRRKRRKKTVVTDTTTGIIVQKESKVLNA